MIKSQDPIGGFCAADTGMAAATMQARSNHDLVPSALLDTGSRTVCSRVSTAAPNTAMVSKQETRGRRALPPRALATRSLKFRASACFRERERCNRRERFCVNKTGTCAMAAFPLLPPAKGAVATAGDHGQISKF